MNDQAGALRQMIQNIKQQRQREPGEGARVVAVTSGKGGVGKTSFAVNMALALGKKGLRVIILDADFGLSNVDVMMGVTPTYDLSHVISNKLDIRDALCDGPYGVRFVSGGSGMHELINLSQHQLGALMENLLQLEDLADVILLDTGAGITRHVMQIISSAREIVVVTTPEPTSIMDSYALIKTIATDSEDHPRIRLVINRADNEAEAEDTLKKVAGVVRLYLKVELEALGYVLSDPAVARAVRLQRPFVISAPQCAAARNIESIAWKFMGIEPAHKGGLKAFLTRFIKFDSQKDNMTND